MARCKQDRKAIQASGRKAQSKLTTLWFRQDGLCWLCKGGMATPGSGGRYEATFDHVIPKSQGGTSHISNLKLAHASCNNSRGNMTPHEWRSRGGQRFLSK